MPVSAQQEVAGDLLVTFDQDVVIAVPTVGDNFLWDRAAGDSFAGSTPVLEASNVIRVPAVTGTFGGSMDVCSYVGASNQLQGTTGLPVAPWSGLACPVV